MKKTALVLRCNASDMSSYGGFIWPGVGQVAECPDWVPDTECGNGLHGWLYGHGDSSTSEYVGIPDAKWLVVEVNEEDIIDLGRKVKFPRGIVRYVGDKAGATGYLTEHEPRSANDAVIGLVKTVGNNQSVMGGNYSVLTGGHHSILTGGNYSTLTGGYRSTLTGGHGSTLTGGLCSTLTGGHYSTLTGGHVSTLTGGDYSTLTGGDWSTLTGGDWSTLTGGHNSTLTGGDYSTLTGGDWSTLSIKWFDYKTNRERISIAYVGEDGIEPNVAYKLDGQGKFIRS
ncbi:MAG: hypothetical protein KGI50_07895 [Patescibacteria group bacterium]|nr:hypothetical protein [Patescibacteria group bacterium]